MLGARFLKIYVYFPALSHFYFACVANNCCPTLLLYLHEGKPQRKCLRNQQLVTPISPAGSLWLDRHNLRLSSSNSNTGNDLIHMDFPVLAPVTRHIILRKSGQRPPGRISTLFRQSKPLYNTNKMHAHRKKVDDTRASIPVWYGKISESQYMLACKIRRLLVSQKAYLKSDSTPSSKVSADIWMRRRNAGPVS